MHNDADVFTFVELFTWYNNRFIMSFHWWQLSTWSGKQQMAVRGDSVVDVHRYCAVVGGLKSWTEYLVDVRAWAGAEKSIASDSVKGTTMSDCEYKLYCHVMLVTF